MFKTPLCLALFLVVFSVGSEAKWRSFTNFVKKAAHKVAPIAKKALSVGAKAATEAVMSGAKDEFDENYNYDDLSAEEYQAIMMDTAEQLRPIFKPDALAYIMEELDSRITSKDSSNEEQLLEE